MEINLHDVGFDVVLLCGQSNCQGWSEGFNADIDYTHPNILQYPSSGKNIGQIQIASEPLKHFTQQPATQIGFPMTFARFYLQTIPANRKILLVPCAYGGSSIKEWMDGGYLFENAVKRTNEVIEKYRNSRLTAILWHQGEADAGGKMPGEEYATKLDSAIAMFRSRITNAGDKVPFFVGGLLNTYAEGADGNSKGKTGREIQKALVEVPDRNLNAYFISADGLKHQSDRTHFRVDAARLLGERYFYKYLDYLLLSPHDRTQAGLFKPQPPNVTSIVPSATSIIIKWDKDGTVENWKVSFQANGASFAEPTYLSSGVTTYVKNNLIPSTKYVVEVFASNIKGENVTRREVTTTS